MAVPVVSPSAFAGMSPVMVLPAPLLSFLSSFACQGGGTLLRVPESCHVRSFPISRGRFEFSQHKLLHAAAHLFRLAQPSSLPKGRSPATRELWYRHLVPQSDSPFSPHLQYLDMHAASIKDKFCSCLYTLKRKFTQVGVGCTKSRSEGFRPVELVPVPPVQPVTKALFSA